MKYQKDKEQIQTLIEQGKIEDVLDLAFDLADQNKNIPKNELITLTENLDEGWIKDLINFILIIESSEGQRINKAELGFLGGEDIKVERIKNILENVYKLDLSSVNSNLSIFIVTQLLSFLYFELNDTTTFIDTFIRSADIMADSFEKTKNKFVYNAIVILYKEALEFINKLNEKDWAEEIHKKLLDFKTEAMNAIPEFYYRASLSDAYLDYSLFLDEFYEHKKSEAQLKQAYSLLESNKFEPTFTIGSAYLQVIYTDFLRALYSNSYSNSNNLIKEALEFCNEFLKKVKPDNITKAEVYRELIRFYLYADEIEKAKEYYKEEKRLVKEIGAKRTPKDLLRLSETTKQLSEKEFEKEDSKEGVYYLKESIALLNQLSENEITFETVDRLLSYYTDLSDYYNEHGDFKKEVEILKKCLQIQDSYICKSGDEIEWYFKIRFLITTLLLAAYVNQEQFNKAEMVVNNFLNEIQEFLEQNPDFKDELLLEIFDLNYALGVLETELGNIEASNKKLKEILDWCEENSSGFIEENNIVEKLNLQLAENHIIAKDADKAVFYLEKVLAQSKNELKEDETFLPDFLIRLKDLLTELGNLYIEQNNTKRADICFQRAENLFNFLIPEEISLENQEEKELFLKAEEHFNKAQSKYLEIITIINDSDISDIGDINAWNFPKEDFDYIMNHYLKAAQIYTKLLKSKYNSLIHSSLMTTYNQVGILNMNYKDEASEKYFKKSLSWFLKYSLDYTNESLIQGYITCSIGLINLFNKKGRFKEVDYYEEKVEQILRQGLEKTKAPFYYPLFNKIYWVFIINEIKNKDDEKVDKYISKYFSLIEQAIIEKIDNDILEEMFQAVISLFDSFFIDPKLAYPHYSENCLKLEASLIQKFNNKELQLNGLILLLYLTVQYFSMGSVSGSEVFRVRRSRQIVDRIKTNYPDIDSSDLNLFEENVAELEEYFPIRSAEQETQRKRRGPSKKVQKQRRKQNRKRKGKKKK